MKAIKTLFLSLAPIVFLLFVEMNVYQILYPAWYAECRVGGVFVRATCSEDKAKAMRFIDASSRDGMTKCTVTRLRKCP